MLFWLDFQHVQSDLCKWYKMQQHVLFSMSPREPMSHLYLPALATTTSCGSHQVQNIGACLQNSHGLCILLPLLSPMRPHPFPKSVASKWATAHGLIAEKHKITLQYVFFHHTLLVEWPT